MVAAAVAVALVGCGETVGEKGEPFTLTRATNAQVEELIATELGDTDDGEARLVAAVCQKRQTCVISYDTDEPAFNPEKEILHEQKPIWAQLFNDPNLQEAKITVNGPVTTVGGKEKVAKVMSVTCDREADDQIDWANIDTAGIKELCRVRTFVKL